MSREVFIRGEAVGVLLFDPVRDVIALVEQFRCGPFCHGGEPWQMELVAGMVEPGESPGEVASRESVEEANCVIEALLPISEYYPSPGGCSEYVYVLCGKSDLSRAGGIFGLAEEHEDIRVQVLSCERAFADLAAGKFRNAMTIIALQWLQLNKARVCEQWC